MGSRKLDDLNLELAVMAKTFLDECEEKYGVIVLITCTYRSPEEQQILWNRGRLTPGPVVTWAKPGQSMHNIEDEDGKPASKAFDCVPIRLGKPVWGTTGEDFRIWQQLGSIGTGLGLEWGGLWSAKKREFPHFQLPSVGTV